MPAVAKEALIKGFKLKDEQATYILDMPLRRLTKVSKLELETEQKELGQTIALLKTLLSSEEKIKTQVSGRINNDIQEFCYTSQNSNWRRLTFLEASS